MLKVRIIKISSHSVYSILYNYFSHRFYDTNKRVNYLKLSLSIFSANKICPSLVSCSLNDLEKLAVTNPDPEAIR